MARVLDVRGYSCPQPALMVAAELGKASEDEITVLADPGAPEGNIMRAAARAGWGCSAPEAGPEGGISLRLRRKGP